MTQKQLCGVVAFWQGRLGLSHWKLAVDFGADPVTEHARAEIHTSIHYDEADIYVARDWQKWSKAEAHGLMVHELMHLVCRDLDRVHADAEQLLHPEVWKAFDLRYQHEIEGVVDRLALRFVAMAGIS
jgi:hypothetical protein